MHKPRYLALDAMRGFTLALMILVNSPGSWSDIYPALQHVGLFWLIAYLLHRKKVIISI